MSHALLDAQISDAYLSGLPWTEICRSLQISRTTLTKVRKRLQLERPTAYARGPQSRAWKGGIYRDQIRGYVYEWVDPVGPLADMRDANGRCLQHRLRMAMYLGRPLTTREQVHHINGKHDDNRLENLQFRIGAHGTGQKVVCAACGSENVLAVTL